MKLVEGKYGLEIELHSDRVSVLVIEKSEILVEIISRLYQQINDSEEYFSLLNVDKKLVVSKKIEFILEPFSLIVNDRKLLTSIYTELSEIMNEKYFAEKNYLYQNILNYLDNAVQESDLPLVYTELTDVNGLMKLFELKVEADNLSLLERIMLYMKLCIQIKKVEVIIYLNLKSYLNEEEIVYLYEYAEYNKVCLLLIESSQKEKNNREQVYILDKDGCLICY